MNRKRPLYERELAFYEHIGVTGTTRRNYLNALNSRFFRDCLETNFNHSSIFEVSELNKLWEIYSYFNLHPKNVKNHRCYSAPIMRYIRFLNEGKKYGRRIDFQKKRPKKVD